MKIRRLEILGFKSFSDKTVIEFQDGITGIVGPNGCGKSNIVDSIRWVMGEMSAKHLRGKAMEDVIFSGTQHRASTGMAEVTLVFSAEDGAVPAAFAGVSEIAVRRRLYRSGESEYFINKVACRLKDIHDLFLGTGVGVRAYSIIEQGRIGQVLSSKAEERRLILEEAAGISKFKSRKEAALRKMEATRANLLRLSDILTELKRQMNSLDRQARKAERYREIETELREIELHLGSLVYLEKAQELSQWESVLQETETQEAALAGGIAEREATLETQRLTLVEQDRDYLKLQEELYEKNNSVQLHQAEVDYKTREIDSTQQQIEAAAREIEMVKDRLGRLESSLNSVQQDQQSIDTELAQASQGFAQLESQWQVELGKEKAFNARIDGQNQVLYGLLKKLSDASGRQESLSRRKVDIKGRIAKDQAEIDEIDRLLKSNQSRWNDLSKELGETQQFKLDLSQQTESVRTTIVRQKELLVQLETESNTLRDRLALKASRLKSLEDLEKNLEGYQEGVRNILLKKRQNPEGTAVFGTVADFLDTESHYESAVSAVLGAKLQYVVVQSQEAGVEALQYLKEQSSGRLSCIPLSLRTEEFSEAGALEGEPGVLGPLNRFVKFKGEQGQIGDYLFSDVVLVENLRHALQLWNQAGLEKTLVTLDGEVVDPAGVVTGGGARESSQALLEKKREIKDLRIEVQGLEAQLAQKKEEVQACRGRVQQLEQSLEVLKRDSHSEELKLVHRQQDLNHLKNEIRRLGERRDKLSLEISSSMQEESDLVRQIEGFVEVLSQGEEERKNAEAQLEQFKLELASNRGQLDVLRGQMMDSKSHLALVQEKKSAFEKDLRRMSQERVEAQRLLESKMVAITSGHARITQFKGEIEVSRASIAEWVKDIQEKESLTRQLKEQVLALQAAVHEIEAVLRQDRQKIEGLRQEIHQHIRWLSEGRTKIQVLREQILERYHLDLGEVAPSYRDKPLEDREGKERQARELRERLEKLGSVNLGAIEEYQEMQQRFEFLNKQYQDLDQSLDGLTKALQKVNRTTKQRLVETFHKVNELFQEVFPRLFKGGHAELRLTDPENILESGVEIIAQPPGKKLQNVTLLSGGEKALTAISLVFAIFLLKPSPFCLLDEVDAPLDDVNIERFNEMVKSMVGRSQFILITHNKKTMEMADVLYGITMEQAGVSKLVSVDLGN